MMRAPKFRYLAPKTVREAASMLAGEPGAMPIAGGTDLVPNMKRRTQTPATLVALSGIAELRAIHNGDGVTIGAGATLAEVAASPLLTAHRAQRTAAASVATVHLRNMGTIGGNLCLDTRCTYYNQNQEWREAISYCMKAPKSTGGEACLTPDGSSICWVATSSPRCWAVSSTDTAPALIALGAEVTLAGPAGERRIPLEQLYGDDGMAYLTKSRDELVTAVHVPSSVVSRTSSVYWKLRRRGSFDFPVLGVAAALSFDGGVVTAARVVLGALESRPIILDLAQAPLVGARLDEERIRAVADLATKHARPLDNTDFELSWRKKVVKSYVSGALRELAPTVR
jgi:4-hydroxybenzoyl-CoA reductase subunit beta